MESVETAAEANKAAPASDKSAPSVRRYFLGNTFQSRFLLVSLLHYFVIIVTFIVVLFGPLMLQLDGLSESLSRQGDVASQFLLLHERVWVPLSLVIVLLMLHSVLFSHRIAGPLYRYRSIFKAVGDGNLAMSVDFRKDDYLREETDSLNEMMESLAASMREIEDQCSQVRAALADVRHAVERGAMNEVDQTTKSLDEKMQKLGASVYRFRTRT